MSNTLLTLGGITREAIRLWKNTNAFLQNIDTQYDSSYARTGAKIGSQLRIRLPNDFTVRTGQAVSLNAISEVSTTLTMATQKGVDLELSSSERTLSMDDFSKRILAPAINNLAGDVAADIMSGAEAVCNFVSKTSSGSIVSPDSSTWLTAGAVLDTMSAPRGGRKAVLDPYSQARTVSSLSGLFNPTGTIAKQYVQGEVMGPALGIEEWMSDQTVIQHTTAAYGTLPTVSGASQTGNSITVSTTTAPLSKGDIITFAGVNAVNRITKVDIGQLAQFVVTANVATGSTSIPIYPALTPPSGGLPVQYQTVTASPANGAAISVVTTASEAYRKNLVYRPEAITMVTADMDLPRGVNDAAREAFDGISMRMVEQYAISSDQWITRLDILYGYLYVRPEWAVIVADLI